MRWERLFGELEGHAEHARVEERDALIADLNEGEWAARTWLDGLADDAEIEIDVLDVGVLVGRVQMANSILIHLVGARSEHLIATGAVRWVRGGVRAVRRDPGSVMNRIGWGAVLRALSDEGAPIRLTLAGAAVLEGTIAAVGRDFVRLSSAPGHDRDVPTGAIRVVTAPCSA